MSQREDNVTDSIHAMKQALGINGGQFGGGQIHAFREGWALDVWVVGGKAHYWRRSPLNLAYVRSQCGITTDAKNMYGQGDFGRCRKCAATV